MLDCTRVATIRPTNEIAANMPVGSYPEIYKLESRHWHNACYNLRNTNGFLRNGLKTQMTHPPPAVYVRYVALLCNGTLRTSTGSTAPIAAEVGGVGDDEQVTSAEAELHLVQIASEKATADLEILRRNLFEVQRACAKAIEGRQAAESRIVELEFGVLEAEKKRALTSERTESRLEVLRLAFEEEEREGAAQVQLLRH